MTDYSLKLNQCIAVLPDIRSISGNYPDITYNKVAFDSRKIQPGSIYVALAGINVDGHDFIQHAIQKGACAVIGTKDMPSELAVPYIRVADARLAMAWASAALYRFPSNEMVMIGVTGTDGKTTTSTYLYNILREAGFKASLISTVSAVIDDQEIDTGFHVTTPESPDIQHYLAEMRDAGVTHAVCEVTSHGLAQQRVAAIDFDIAVVTNITHEHLDYHNSREAYFAAKGILFQNLGKKDRATKPLAVLNGDDPDSYNFLKKITTVRKVSYSASGELQNAVSRIESIVSSPSGLKADVVFKNLQGISGETKIPVTTNLLGIYNGSNLLAAMTAAIYGLGVSPETAAKGIAAVQSIPGRMEVIDYGQKFTAIVDFAHTPNALKQALDSARAMLVQNQETGAEANRIIAIFGSAGLRDREKRRMMPRVSIKNADITILTAEDPRTEPLSDILSDMVDAAIQDGAVLNKNVFIEPDRRDAIRLGIAMAKPGDIVISCGKGHEQSMCFGTTEFPWDDRTAMKAALCEFLHLEGPDMPYLPDKDHYLDKL